MYCSYSNCSRQQPAVSSEKCSWAVCGRWQPAGLRWDEATTDQVTIPERELDSEAFVACYTPDR